MEPVISQHTADTLNLATMI